MTVPLVDFGEDVDNNAPPSLLDATFHSSGRSNARLPRLSKLQRYLNSLSLQPSSNPMLDEPIDDLGTGTNSAPPIGESDADAYDGFGSFALPTLDANEGYNHKSQRSERNAEMDSFVYIESLLESLAVLGKLGVGLDTVGQRVAAEIFALVEGTVEEVEDRNDSSKSFANSGRPTSSSLAPSSAGITSLSLSHASTQRSSLLRLSATETNELESNVETLRDLFWTLFSKLDAVLQGFRVAYEVAGRISEVRRFGLKVGDRELTLKFVQRRDFKDSSLVKTSSGNLLFSLIEVWKPVQQEVCSSSS